MAGEITRVQGTYGPEALTAITSSHHNWGLVHYKASPFRRFFSMLGYTAVFDNPDSWEGFHWGGPHMYGYFWRLGCPEAYDLLEDCLQNTDMIVHWSNDPDTIRGGYCAQESAIWRVWMRKLGIKMVYIDPFCNATAAKDADKWLAPRPGTDTALAEAIAYVWLTEGTYDKDFIERKSLGFDTWVDHILGKSDGRPKTPEWAAELTGLHVGIIRALAREWAKKNVMLGLRRPRRLRRRAPDGLRPRVGAADDRPRRDAGNGQAGQQPLGRCTRRSHRLQPEVPRLRRRDRRTSPAA